MWPPHPPGTNSQATIGSPVGASARLSIVRGAMYGEMSCPYGEMSPGSQPMAGAAMLRRNVSNRDTSKYRRIYLGTTRAATDMREPKNLMMANSRKVVV